MNDRVDPDDELEEDAVDEPTVEDEADSPADDEAWADAEWADDDEWRDDDDWTDEQGDWHEGSGRAAATGDGPIDDDPAFDDPAFDDPAFDDDPAFEDPALDDEYVTVPPERSRASRILVVLGGLLAIVALLVVVVAWWVSRQIDPPGSAGEEVTLEIPEGATTTDVARVLEEQEVIANAFIFRMYVRQQGAGPFQAGSYDGLRVGSSMGEVVERLDAGPIPPAFATITIPEGLTLEQVRELLLAELPLDAAALDAALASVRSTFQPEGASLEGFLYPDTYRIEQGTESDATVVVQTLVDQFDVVATELGYGSDDPAVNPGGLTPYELVTLASIIEREARIAEDQGKVSRVVHNRLDEGMRLEIDATLLYAIGHTDTLTESDLDTDSPYNTRLYAGLPPTPIANPGRGALEAAIRPPEGDWLYYVLADANGGHLFTSDYDEFLRQKRQSQEEGLF